jgi:hypothetical protein
MATRNGMMARAGMIVVAIVVLAIRGGVLSGREEDEGRRSKCLDKDRVDRIGTTEGCLLAWTSIKLCLPATVSIRC